MIGKKTLLLDSGYQPIKVISWMRAIELLLAGKAEMVEEYEDVPVRSQRLTLNLPSVLRLVKAFKRRRRLEPKFSRYNIYYRDQWTCQYCRTEFKSEDLTFDHVVPISQGGQTTWENIVTACHECNRHKGGRTPLQARMSLMKTPEKLKRTPSWVLRLKEESVPEEWATYLYWHTELQKG